MEKQLTVDEVVRNFQSLSTSADYLNNQRITFCGRISYKRGPFYDLEGTSSHLQIFVGKELQNKHLLRGGMIVLVEGRPGITKKGEFCVFSESLQVREAPESAFRELTGVRSVDDLLRTTFNRQARRRIVQSYELIEDIRSSFSEWGFREVSTNILQTVSAGGNAAQFSVQDGRLLRSDFDLETRAFLLIMDKVYQLGKVFRNEGTSDKNRNEFHFVNFYDSYSGLAECFSRCLGILQRAAAYGGVQETNIHMVEFSAAVRSALAQEDIPFSTCDFDGAGKMFESILAKIAEQKFDSLLNGMAQMRGELGEQADSDLGVVSRYFRKKIRYVQKGICVVVGYPSRGVPFAKDESNGIARDFHIVWDGRTIFHGSEEINQYSEQVKKYQRNHGNGYDLMLSSGERRYLEILRRGMPQYTGASISLDLLIQQVLGVPDVNKLFPEFL